MGNRHGDHAKVGGLLRLLGCIMLERRVVKAGYEVCSDDQLLEIRHLILAHHGTLELGSPPAR